MRHLNRFKWIVSSACGAVIILLIVDKLIVNSFISQTQNVKPPKTSAVTSKKIDQVLAKTNSFNQ